MALLAVAAACSQSPTGPGPGLHRNQLLALARDDSGPFSPVIFSFHNNQTVNFPVLESDSAATILATLHFSFQSIVSRNDSILADTSTVAVSFAALPGEFGFTVGPSTLFFNTAGSPTVDISYTRYANFTVFDSSSRYATAQAFEQALELWYEYGADEWQPTRNSTHSGASVVSSALEQPGAYILAARK